MYPNMPELETPTPYVKPLSPTAKGALPPAPATPAALQTAPQIEVIIRQGATGELRVENGGGGKLTRSQESIYHYGTGHNPCQVAKLVGAPVPDRDFESMAVFSHFEKFTYQALFCGETFFQAIALDQVHKSLILRLLSLADKITWLKLPSRADYSPDKVFKGLMSNAGTPLEPLEGRRINLFGEGEALDFENWSSDIDFCSHQFCNGNAPDGATYGHRPWTEDPRPEVRIPDKSVLNICCRSSPIYPVTVGVIKRIAASGCPLTYAEADGKGENCENLKKGLTGWTVIAEGSAMSSGRGIVLELP